MSEKTSPLVLVVEDEPLLRMLARELLEEVGYDVLEAPDGASALSLLERHAQVDLVFTDVHMPGALDGMALARKVNARWPNMHLLVTSGRERPCASSFPDNGKFMEKPYSPDDLLRHVRELTQPH